MILIVAAAILGAAVGLFVQPRLFALAIALSMSGAAHLVLSYVRKLAETSPGHFETLRWLDLVTGSDVHGIWPVMAAAGAGAILAAVLWSVTRKQSTDVFWFMPSDGDRRNGIRSMTMVEDRDIHEEARRRLDALLER